MTKVYLEQDGDRYLVSCLGHATGSVEMCAAISCLMGTLEGWLDGHGAEVTERCMEPGRAVLRFTGGDDCKTAFEVLCAGFFRLAATDDTHIQVKFLEI